MTKPGLATVMAPGSASTIEARGCYGQAHGRPGMTSIAFIHCAWGGGKNPAGQQWVKRWQNGKRGPVASGPGVTPASASVDPVMA